MLGYISPMHYALAQAPCTDDDGTSDVAYWALVHRLEALHQEQPNFFFLDLHRDGHNDLKDEDYFNWDHVNFRGAAKVSARLEAERRRIDALPRWDVSPPRVVAVTAVGDPSRIEVCFSEPIHNPAVSAAEHYRLDGGAQVRGVRTQDLGRRVTLQTSPLQEGRRYTLSIEGLSDRGGNALRRTRVSVTYLQALRLRATSRPAYVWDTLAKGRPLHVDAQDALTEAPQRYEGLRMLRTAQADRAAKGAAFLTFEANGPVRVYVAHDERIPSKPAWLAPDLWTYTWDFLKAGKQTYRLLYRDFPAGKVTLGGNEAPEGNMYVVLVEPWGRCDAPE